MEHGYAYNTRDISMMGHNSGLNDMEMSSLINGLKEYEKGLFLSSFTLYSKITHKFIEEVFREASVPDDVENYWIDQTIKITMN